MRIKSPLLIKAAGRLGYVVLSCLFATVNRELEFDVVDPYNSTGQQRYLFTLWHDSSVMAALFGRPKRTIALTSRHRDGSFVASILAPAGVRTVRGSTGKGGYQAARELINLAQEKDICLVPDGPRGPRRQISRGVVYLSSRTGNPIVPTGFACDRFWEVKSSWTSHWIPRPGSHLVLVAGEPVFIPGDVSPDDLHTYQVLVQNAMDQAQERAYRRLECSQPNAIGHERRAAA